MRGIPPGLHAPFAAVVMKNADRAVNAPQVVAVFLRCEDQIKHLPDSAAVAHGNNGLVAVIVEQSVQSLGNASVKLPGRFSATFNGEI